MKCPYCQTEMTDGYVKSARNIFFDRYESGLFYIANKSSVKVTRFWGPYNRKAAYCPTCNKLIIDLNLANTFEGE